MSVRSSTKRLPLVLALALAAGTGMAGSAVGPLDTVRESTDRVIAIAKDPELKAPGKEDERRQKMIQVIDEGFHWQDMAQRSLGRHWQATTAEQREQFIPLFTELCRGTYMSRIENYSGEEVHYKDERVEGDYARVNVEITSLRNSLIPVVYSMKRYGERWMVYDVAVEGVKIVNNYRRQFDDILNRRSFDHLLKQMQETIAKREKGEKGEKGEKE